MAIQIPLVVALWEHPNYTGRRRLVVEDIRDLTRLSFNNIASSVGVHPGPDYTAWKAANGGKEPTVGLYADTNYGSAVLMLKAGGYPNIRTLYNFEDTISSVKFNPAILVAHSITPVPLIVELYKDGFNGNYIVVVENCPDISAVFGSDFNDVTTAVRVKKGPDWTAGNVAKLFRNTDYNPQPGIDLPPGDYPNIGTSHSFNDVVSSIQVR